MTRFARAKGSKSSNERLPEQATSWGELKNELLQKNKEKDNKIAQEKAFEQRTANYKAFLKEREEEEAKNTSWAEFPSDSVIPVNHDGKGKKSNKFNDYTMNNQIELNNEKVMIQKVKKRNADMHSSQGEVDSLVVKNKKAKKNNKKSVDNQGTFDFDNLKNKLDIILDSSMLKNLANDSDSEGPPEEASAKNKPEEVVVKKAKIKKKLLKIVQNRQERHDNNFTQNDSNQQNNKTVKKLNSKHNHNGENDLTENNYKKDESQQDLSEKALLKIEKKKERYQKQLEKKKQKRAEQKINKQNEKSSNENSNVESMNKKHKKKGPVVPEYNNENLTDKQLLKIQKKKERRARQAEKRKKIREMKHQDKEQNGQDNHEENVKKGEKKENSEKKKADKMNLSQKDLENLQRRKAKLARQAEKRKTFKEEKQLQEQLETSNVETSENKKHIEEKNKKPFETENKELIERENNNSFKEHKVQVLPRKDFNENSTSSFKSEPTKKKIKNRDDKDYKRNKPLQKLETMFINGKQVEIDYIDGFPIKKEDADRIRQLRKDMNSKGLPRTEIDIALKLERRRAEKALTKEKKTVCFNCRKSGHNLSECPELGNGNQMIQSASTGICFKCGSTEHTHFECRVERGDVYKFASCFICNEQGHIAKQCPDNQRGLYPKGGACKVCGDVTHLKKDCPKYQMQQQHLQSGLSVGTLDNSNPDVMEGSNNNVSGGGGRDSIRSRGPNKVVKF